MIFKFSLLKSLKFTQSLYHRMSSCLVTTSNNEMHENFRVSRHKIGICQLTCNEDKYQNFSICKALITKAKNQGAEVFISIVI